MSLRQQANLAEAERAHRQQSRHTIARYVFEHTRLQRRQRRLREHSPDIMTEVKQLVPMHVRLRDVEVRADQRNQKGVEQPVYEFQK